MFLRTNDLYLLLTFDLSANFFILMIKFLIFKTAADNDNKNGSYYFMVCTVDLKFFDISLMQVEIFNLSPEHPKKNYLPPALIRST